MQRVDALRVGIRRPQDGLQPSSEEQERNDFCRTLAKVRAIACLVEEEVRLENGAILPADVRRWRLRARAMSAAAETDRAQSTYSHLAGSYQKIADRAEARLRHRN